MKHLHLLYHELRSEKSRYSYVTPCAEFEEHCALFARVREARSRELLQPELTFDDGHTSDVLYALPALERHGLRATFFITAGWTGQRAGYMNWSQLRQLQAAGHRIGAHGLEHKLLTGCSEPELDRELVASRQLLEDGLGVAVNVMSLPGGRADARVLRACDRAGYEQIFTSIPRAEAMEDRPRLVGRLNLVGGTGVPWLERLLDPGTGVLDGLERTDRLKSTAKRLLGDRLYARLWATVIRQEAGAAEGEAAHP